MGFIKSFVEVVLDFCSIVLVVSLIILIISSIVIYSKGEQLTINHATCLITFLITFGIDRILLEIKKLNK